MSKTQPKVITLDSIYHTCKTMGSAAQLGDFLYLTKGSAAQLGVFSILTMGSAAQLGVFSQPKVITLDSIYHTCKTMGSAAQLFFFSLF